LLWNCSSKSGVIGKKRRRSEVETAQVSIPSTIIETVSATGKNYNQKLKLKYPLKFQNAL
jgi:hypothetical protein